MHETAGQPSVHEATQPAAPRGPEVYDISSEGGANPETIDSSARVSVVSVLESPRSVISVHESLVSVHASESEAVGPVVIGVAEPPQQQQMTAEPH